MKILLLSIYIILLATSAFGEQTVKCKGNPDVVGECKTIRVRLSVYNGTPSLRIWVVGTKRLLGVLPSESEIMPDELLNIFKQNTAATVFADFEVCPFSEEKEGHMQSVCIESYSYVRVE